MTAMKMKAVIKGKKMKGFKTTATKANGQLSAAAIKATMDPLSVLKATDKVAKAKFAVQTRVYACHGKVIRDVLNSVIMGARYKMPDLIYDVRNGRLKVLPPKSSAGPAPKATSRCDAPLAGKPLPPASVDDFFNFLQGQLKMELKEHTGQDLALHSKAAQAMWPDIQAFVAPNLGKSERWVPYHTVLGVHEKFVVEEIHNSKSHGWDEKQRFVAMFLFRAHCKCDLFKEVQAPLMAKPGFWKDPIKAFADGGPMEKAILAYRKRTGNPLLTSCFRIIPERLLKDDTQNLVRSITMRSQRLIAIAERAFPVIKDKKKTAAQKMYIISTMIQEGQGLGETWAKMLTVCIDLAYPRDRLLESQCDVGAGALVPMRCLLPQGGPTDKRAALVDLLAIANTSKSDATKQFWQVLKASETVLRKHFKDLTLVHAQANTQAGRLSACTLQVQLCEYRQFRHSLARLRYGLPDDESMRGEPENEGSRDHDYVTYDEQTACMWFEHRDEEHGTNTTFEVPVKLTQGNRPVAKRLAGLCRRRLRGDNDLKAALKFRDDLARTYRPGADAPEDSLAWRYCKVGLEDKDHSAAVAFDFVCKDGKKIPFQTTVTAAGGVFEAERIARLCWMRFAAGHSKEATKEYRNKLYQKGSGDGPGRGLAKRPAAADGAAAAPPAKKARK